jgi:hypothetical protein
MYDQETGIETPRARVTLATQLPESVCKELNLGYRNPAFLCLKEYADRESEGVLFVPRAGEMLFRLK